MARSRRLSRQADWRPTALELRLIHDLAIAVQVQASVEGRDRSNEGPGPAVEVLLKRWSRHGLVEHDRDFFGVVMVASHLGALAQAMEFGDPRPFAMADALKDIRRFRALEDDGDRHVVSERFKLGEAGPHTWLAVREVRAGRRRGDVTLELRWTQSAEEWQRDLARRSAPPGGPDESPVDDWWVVITPSEGPRWSCVFGSGAQLDPDDYCIAYTSLVETNVSGASTHVLWTVSVDADLTGTIDIESGWPGGPVPAQRRVIHVPEFPTLT